VKAIFATAAAALVLSGMARAECVQVEGANPDVPRFQATNGRIRPKAMQEGKALADVYMLFYRSNYDAHSKDVNSKLDLTTDKQGVLFTTGLAPGRYHVQAIAPEHEFSEVYREVRGGRGRETNSYVLNIPPTFLPEKPADLARVAISERVQGFKGRVIDQSGGYVSEAFVRVYRRNAGNDPVAKLEVDQEGLLSAALGPGPHVVFVTSQGFFKKIVGF
jgi:hypothetical protein